MDPNCSNQRITSTRDCTWVRENEPFNDGKGDGEIPYCGGPTDYNTEGFDRQMFDSPGRLSNSSYVKWRAEVTIGGLKDGVFVAIGPMTYGFDIIDGKTRCLLPARRRT